MALAKSELSQEELAEWVSLNAVQISN